MPAVFSKPLFDRSQPIPLPNITDLEIAFTRDAASHVKLRAVVKQRSLLATKSARSEQEEHRLRQLDQDVSALIDSVKPSPVRLLAMLIDTITTSEVPSGVERQILALGVLSVNQTFNYFTYYKQVTLLHIVVQYRRIHHAGLLLSLGADPFILNNMGRSPFCFIIEMAATQPEFEDDAVKMVDQFFTPLHREDCRALITDELYPGAGSTLAMSAIEGLVKLCDRFLATGLCDLSEKYRGIPILHWIASLGNELSSNVNHSRGTLPAPPAAPSTAPENKSFSTDLALMRKVHEQRKAKSGNYAAILRLFHRADADIHAIEPLYLFQPIHHAVSTACPEIINALLEAGAGMNAPSMYGTPLDLILWSPSNYFLTEAELETAICFLLSKGAHAHRSTASILFNQQQASTRMEVFACLATLVSSSHPAVIAIRNNDLEGLRHHCSLENHGYVVACLFNLIAFAPENQVEMANFLLSRPGLNLQAYTLGTNGLLHVMAITRNYVLLKQLLEYNPRLIHAPANYRGESLQDLFQKGKWKQAISLTDSSSVKAITASSSTAASAAAIPLEEDLNKATPIIKQIIAALPTAQQHLKAMNLASAMKELKNIHELLDQLDPYLNDSQVWLQYQHYHEQYVGLIELYHAQLEHAAASTAGLASPLAAKTPSAMPRSEKLKLVSNLYLHHRLEELLAQYATSEPETQNILIQQIRYTVIHLLDGNIEHCRALYHLRQLLVHHGHDWAERTSHVALIDLATTLNKYAPREPTSLATSDRHALDAQFRTTICYSTFMPSGRKRPNFSDKRPLAEAMAAFWNALITLANCDTPSAKKASLSETEVNDQELAGNAIYSLREFLRLNIRREWTHPYRATFIARLKAAVKDRELVEIFCNEICNWGNSAIHRPSGLHVQGSVYQKISAAQVRQLCSLARELISRGLSFESFSSAADSGSASATSAILLGSPTPHPPTPSDPAKTAGPIPPLSTLAT